MFIFACSLAFMLACPFALLGAGVLALLFGVAVIVIFALPLVFELFALLQAPQKTAAVSKNSRVIVRRIEVPPILMRRLLRSRALDYWLGGLLSPLILPCIPCILLMSILLGRIRKNSFQDKGLLP